MKDLYVYPFYAMGWVAGYIVRLALLTWAAITEGFYTSRRL